MLNNRKDEKIQLYKRVSNVSDTSTREIYSRHFIYDYDTFMNGGLWANARMMSNTEVVNSGLSFDRVNVKFTVNRNAKITNDLKVIYRGKIYDIGTIDELDFRSPDMSFTAVYSPDTVNYSGGDEFE